ELAQNLIPHRRVRPTTDVVAELRLDHAERALDIRALVIVTEKLVAPELEVTEHSLPQRPGFARNAVDLERDECRPAMPFDQLQILFRQVGFVRTDFAQF